MYLTLSISPENLVFKYFSVNPFPSTSTSIVTFPISFLFKKVPISKLSSAILPLYDALSIVLILVINSLDFKLPSSVFRLKSASINVVVISASPTKLNLPNFFKELGIFFAKTLGKSAVRLS